MCTIAGKCHTVLIKWFCVVVCCQMSRCRGFQMNQNIVIRSRLKNEGCSYNQIRDRLQRWWEFTSQNVALWFSWCNSQYPVPWNSDQLRRPRAPYKTKLNDQQIQLIDDIMHSNRETTATQLVDFFRSNFGVLVSAPTICRVRKALGWTFKKTKYCQLKR